MSSAEQPGQSDSKPQGDPAEVISEAEVEKTLGQLESMTTTLVQEVGAPPRKAPVAEAPEPAAQPAAAAPVATEEPQAEGVVAAPAEAGADGSPAANPEDSQSASDTQPLEAGPQAVNENAESAGSPAEPQAASRTAAQVEIDQEINQALQQLQQGGPNPAAAAKPAMEAGSAEVPRESRRFGRLCIRILDALLSPIVLLVVLLDLPFRWLPGVVRHLLGYIAIGTALMAAALWVYVLAAKATPTTTHADAASTPSAHTAVPNTGEPAAGH